MSGVEIKEQYPDFSQVRNPGILLGKGQKQGKVIVVSLRSAMPTVFLTNPQSPVTFTLS